MAELTVIYWRDIPAQVVAKSGRRSAKVVLAERFEKAIDRAAMRAKLRDTDSYLEQWRRGAPVPCDDDLDAAARRLAAELEAAFDDARLAAFVQTGGLTPEAGEGG